MVFSSVMSPVSNIHYSIIIPHKNLPSLLVRCLDSIPKRDDIQVIVVDDNSSSEIVDFNNFPGKGRENVEVYFTHRSGGTGYAQNIGLEHAVGKWVLFIGADDFFTEEVNSFLDRMVDAPEDLIVFDHRSVLSDDVNSSVDRSAYLSKLIDDYLNGRIDEKYLRCKYIVATCKLIRRDLIENHHIRFNETMWSNDNYFSAQVSCFADSIKVCNDVIYVMTVRDGSLTSDYCGTRKEAEIRLQEAIKSDNLYRKNGLDNNNILSESVLRTIGTRHGFWKSVGYCVTYIPNWPVFKATASFLFRKTVHHFSS